MFRVFSDHKIHSYHSGKANVVIDILSRKTLHVSTLMVKELDLIEQFIDLSVTLKSVRLGVLKKTSSLLMRSGVVRLQDRVCVPGIPNLKRNYNLYTFLHGSGITSLWILCWRPNISVAKAGNSKNMDSTGVIADNLEKLTSLYISEVDFTSSFGGSLHKASGTNLSLSSSFMAKRCRTPLCWFESGESLMLGPKKMRVAYKRQKNYNDKRRKDLKFNLCS
ncbi:hypothetical protein CR513_18147, partial [Mucuna pruriens]